MPDIHRHASFAPAAALVAAMVLWSSSFVAMKIAVMGMHPMQAMALRMVIACLALAPFALKARGQVRAYRRGDWLLLALVALFEPCLYFLFEAYALTYTYASQASMIASLLPVMILISARLNLKEPISARTGFGFGLAVAGAVWLSSAGSGEEGYAPNPLLGNFLEFLGMASATISTILVKRLTARYSPHFLTAIQSVGGLLFFVPLSLAMVGPPDTRAVSALAVPAVAYLGVFVSLGAYGLWNYALSRLPAGKASISINLIPVFSVILAFFIMGERFSTQQFAAAGVVLLGVLITRNWRKT
jgi:drug/metabolite transporter (DMT)-like permease